MAWYRIGTVGVANGSHAVTGVGTDWLALTGVAQVSNSFIGPDGRPYEVGSITAAGALQLVEAYAGGTASGQPYAIMPTMGLTAELARQVGLLVQQTADAIAAGSDASAILAQIQVLQEQVDSDSNAAMGYRNEANLAKTQTFEARDVVLPAATAATDAAALAVPAAATATAAAAGAVAAAETVGSFKTKALAQAKLAAGGIPLDKAVNVTADGLNNGLWVNRGGVLELDSTATLPALKSTLDPIAARVHIGSSRLAPFYVRDANRRVAFWVNPAGQFSIAGMQNVKGVIEGVSTKLNATVKSASARSGYAFVLRDASGRAVFGFNLAGHLMYHGVDVHASLDPAVINGLRVDVNNLLVASAKFDSTVRTASARSGYAFVVRDASRRAAFGISMAGRMMYRGADVHDLLDPTAVNALKAVVYPSPNIVIWGDSLTQGAGTGTSGKSIGVQLQALYGARGDARTVTSFGFGGQRGAAILARQGSAPITVLLPNGTNGFPEIPASGAINVTVSMDILTLPPPSNSATDRSLAGTISGVPVVLTRLASGDYFVARATAGAAVAVDADVPFIPDTAMYRKYTLVCWMNTNDMLSAGAPLTAAQILAQIDTYVGFQETVQRRFVIVMPLLDGANANLAAQKVLYNQTLALVKAKYPRNYIDTMALLRRHNDGSPSDVADSNAGITPGSLSASIVDPVDRLHLNIPGYGVVAPEIMRNLDLQGA